MILFTAKSYYENHRRTTAVATRHESAVAPPRHGGEILAGDTATEKRHFDAGRAYQYLLTIITKKKL